MIPCSFDESNVVLDKPDDMDRDQCEALSVWRGRSNDGTPLVISCWKLTRDELEILLATGRVWLTVLGQTRPPVSLSINKPFTEA